MSVQQRLIIVIRLLPVQILVDPLVVHVQQATLATASFVLVSY